MSDATPEPTRILLVRHGETAWNREQRIQGQIDIDLNAAGEAQARAVRAGLAGHCFAAAYSSDLQRAHDTARPAAEDISQPDSGSAIIQP